MIDSSDPEHAHLVEGARVPLRDARDVYVARTYAYVADGKDGVAIIDVKQPDQPRLDQLCNAEGKLNDARQVKIAMTNASLFAYVADGKNGLRILQLTSPETMATYAGFSPRPEPQLIATFKTKGEALAVSKASIAIVPWTRAATRLPFSVDAERARLRLRKRSGCYGRMEAGAKLLP